MNQKAVKSQNKLSKSAGRQQQALMPTYERRVLPHQSEILSLQHRAGNLAVSGLIYPAEDNTKTGASIPPSVQPVLNSSRGRPLDADIRSNMESRFGEDFSRVRLHTDAQAAESARVLHAAAYTFGEHIVLGGHSSWLQGSEGHRLLTHELAHVIQQRRAGKHYNTTVSTHADSYEMDADRAIASAEAGLPIRLTATGAPPLIQRLPSDDEEKLKKARPRQGDSKRQSTKGKRNRRPDKSPEELKQIAYSPNDAVLLWKSLRSEEQKAVLELMRQTYGFLFAIQFFEETKRKKHPRAHTVFTNVRPSAAQLRDYKKYGNYSDKHWVHPSGHEIIWIGAGQPGGRSANKGGTREVRPSQQKTEQTSKSEQNPFVEEAANYVSDLSAGKDKLIAAASNVTDQQSFQRISPEIQKWIYEFNEDQKRVNELIQTETDPLARDELLKQAQRLEELEQWKSAFLQQISNKISPQPPETNP